VRRPKDRSPPTAADCRPDTDGPQSFEAERDMVHSMIFNEEWETTWIALDED